MTTPTIEQKTASTLSHIFALCDTNRAAIAKAREDAKLSSLSLWYRDGETENQTEHETTP